MLLQPLCGLLVLICAASATPQIRVGSDGELFIGNDADDVLVGSISIQSLNNTIASLVQTLAADRARNNAQVETLTSSLHTFECQLQAAGIDTESPTKTFDAVSARPSKLLDNDGAESDYFGSAVGIGVNMIVVGAYKDDDKGTDSGSVSVFQKNCVSGYYEQASKLVASDGDVDDWFGYAFAVAGDDIIVGASGDGDNGRDSGSAYVYKKDGTGTYAQVSKLYPENAGTADFFGWAMAGTDGMFVAGAYQEDTRAFNGGAAYVFEKNETGSYNQVSRLIASDGTAFDFFGSAVAAAPKMVVIGAYPKGFSRGAAYVFEGNATGYFQVSKLLANDGSTSDSFGWAVGAATGIAVVGAPFLDGPQGDNTGAAYVFQKEAGSYVQTDKLVAQDAAALDNFGRTVAVTSRLIVVGANQDDDKGSNSGGVYVFKQSSGSGSYTQVSKLVASDNGGAEHHFGWVVAATNRMVVVGAYLDNSTAFEAGSAYVFET
eukprot:m.2778 g.2778  ORF g.2778 m.2778 type:complete len:489 (-) comp4070_c0_seq1:39-1505(-)